MNKFNFQDFYRKNAPLIMGILNLTPDSFYDGGLYNDVPGAIRLTEKMLEAGADIIDVGALSSRPFSSNLNEEIEKVRLYPILEVLVQEFPEAIFSVDTFRSNIAQQSIQIGAQMINDISGGSMDADMFKTIAGLQVPYVLMHMQGTPENMQQNPQYEDVIQEVKSFFEEKLTLLEGMGVQDVLLDVGFGFGKSMEHNYALLKHLDMFQDLGKPILAGISRKSMLYKLLDSTPEKVLPATSAAHTLALLNGASILRVHDVKEAKEVVKMIKMYKSV